VKRGKNGLAGDRGGVGYIAKAGRKYVGWGREGVPNFPQISTQDEERPLSLYLRG